MARILLLGDAGVHTGFGTANNELGKRLVTNHGHEVSALAVNFRGDHVDTPLNLFVADIERTGDVYGKKRIIEMLGKIEPDLVWITNDPFIVRSLLWNNEYDTDRWLLKMRPILAYLPIDGSPYPNTWDDGLAQYTRRVAMSKFGAGAMGVDDIVYHGVDTEVFHPVSRDDPIRASNGQVITSKREAKVAYGYPPDAFIVLRVDTNSLRKDYAATWKAVVPVMQRHSNVWCHFHCTEKGVDGGVSMMAMWSRDLKTAPRFRLSDITSLKGIEPRDLAVLYNMADVFVSNSRGEGFGLTIAEASACGIPIIAQNVSAIPEVVGPGGMLIEPLTTITAPGGQEHALSNIEAFTEAIEHLYGNDGFRKRYGRAAALHVRETFNWDREAAAMSAIVTDTIEKTELVPVTQSA